MTKYKESEKMSQYLNTCFKTKPPEIMDGSIVTLPGLRIRYMLRGTAMILDRLKSQLDYILIREMYVQMPYHGTDRE